MSSAASADDDHGAEPADRDRQAEAAEAPGVVRRGQERRGIGADRDETGDADIEQAGLAPLQIEAEADDAVSQRRRQEERAIAEEIEHHVAHSEEAGRPTSSTAIRMQEGDRGAIFGADQLHRRRFGEADDQPAEHRAGHAADAAEDRGGEQRQQQVEAHERAGSAR